MEDIKIFDEGVVDKMPDGMFKIDATLEDDTIYGANKALFGLFGYDEEEFDEKFNMKFGKFVCEQEKESVFEDIRKQAKEKDLVFLKFRVECVDETLRQVIACGRVLREDDEKTWVFMSLVPAESLRHLFSEE